MRKECSSDVSSHSFGGALRDIQKTAADAKCALGRTFTLPTQDNG